MVAEKKLSVMLFDVKCARLYRNMRRIIYNEVPRQDPKLGDGLTMGRLKAMYRTRESPQIWEDTVTGNMVGLWFTASGLHSLIYWHSQRHKIVVTHIDDFLCIGETRELRWLFGVLQKENDLKHQILDPDSQEEVRYLHRVVRRGAHGTVGSVSLSM